jgi:acyl dehydratase
LRAAAFENANGPIAATAFNRTGNIFAYAVSYDWHKVRFHRLFYVGTRLNVAPCRATLV